MGGIGRRPRRIELRRGKHAIGETRGQIIGNEHGLLKLLVDRGSHAILGVHIIGESASELVHVGQMAMTCHATVDVLAATVFIERGAQFGDQPAMFRRNIVPLFTILGDVK